ncbi:MAG: hypothetical protein CME69_05495 [Halobacteriovorax sp.]|nr:hypothetical protein [Halobacteriovorax sp.]
MRKDLYIIFLLLLSLNTYSFINIENLRKNSKQGFNTSGKLLFNQQTGNTDKILYSASTFNSYKKNGNELILIGTLRYGESFDRKDTEDGSLHLRYTYDLTKKHHIESYTQYQYNDFKALNSRKLIGLGYRLTSEYLNAGIGAFNERERLKTTSDENATRGNIYLSSSLKSDTGFNFATIIYYQPALNDTGDKRLILDTGISQEITKRLSMIIEYHVIYDENPPPRIQTTDTSLMFGFTLK